jgi:hypothetical protein
MSDGQSGARSTVLLAGWLFADLAVGLVITLLATATDTPQAPSEPTAPPVALPTSPPGPTPTPATLAGLEQEPLVFEVPSDASDLLGGDPDEVDEVGEAIRDVLGPYEQRGRTAGFVLTWGGSPGNSGEGVALARQANEILRDAVPELTETAALRDLWKGSDGVSRGTLIFEVFLFVEG